jgi:hypothetical protein
MKNSTGPRRRVYQRPFMPKGAYSTWGVPLEVRMSWLPSTAWNGTLLSAEPGRDR